MISSKVGGRRLPEKDLSHIRCKTVTRMDTMPEIVLINQTSVTKVRIKVSTKVRVKENIMHMQQMTMSIRRRDIG